MRNKKREVSDTKEMESFIQKAEVCRLGLCKEGVPYIVPLNFGYKDGSFYFHTGTQGQKIEFIKANDQACVELDVDCEVVQAEAACKFSMKYKSVIAMGRAGFIEDNRQKKKALQIIMDHYSDKTYEFPDELVAKVAVIQVKVDSMTGKKIQ